MDHTSCSNITLDCICIWFSIAMVRLEAIDDWFMFLNQVIKVYGGLKHQIEGWSLKLSSCAKGTDVSLSTIHLRLLPFYGSRHLPISVKITNIGLQFWLDMIKWTGPVALHAAIAWLWLIAWLSLNLGGLLWKFPFHILSLSKKACKCFPLRWVAWFLFINLAF